MITQEAKDHAQACLNATKEACIHSHMGDAQRAAYMTILSNHKVAPAAPEMPKPSKPIKRSPDDCQCDNCARTRKDGGHMPCLGYVAPRETQYILFIFTVLGMGALIGFWLKDSGWTG